MTTPDPNTAATAAPLPDGVTQSADGTVTGTPAAPAPDPASDVAPAPAPATDTSPEAPAQPSPGVASGTPSPELPPTSTDDFDADDPRTQEQTGTATVPDTVQAQIDDPGPVVTDQAHGWDAGSSGIDTGWFTAPGLDEAWTAALKAGHGEQDGYITVPAHLRDLNDAVLTLARTFVGQFDPADSFQVEVNIDEFNGEVNMKIDLDRKPKAN